MDHRPVRKRVGKRERAEERGLGRARVEEEEKGGSQWKNCEMHLEKSYPIEHFYLIVQSNFTISILRTWTIFMHYVIKHVFRLHLSNLSENFYLSFEHFWQHHLKAVSMKVYQSYRFLLMAIFSYRGDKGFNQFGNGGEVEEGSYLNQIHVVSLDLLP